MSKYHISFTLVCPFTNENRLNWSGIVKADNAELAVIFARNDLMKSRKIWGKAIDVRCNSLNG